QLVHDVDVRGAAQAELERLRVAVEVRRDTPAGAGAVARIVDLARPEDLHAGAAAGVHQRRDVRDDAAPHADVESGLLARALRAAEAVLHVDDQERGLLGIDRQIERHNFLLAPPAPPILGGWPGLRAHARPWSSSSLPLLVLARVLGGA